MKLSLIAAVPRNGAIGKNNQLIWTDALDQRHFRATTMGHPVVMGRKTWDSLPERFRPLPGRHNVVVTRNRSLVLAGATVAHSLEQALDALAGTPQVFVMGGAELYTQAMPLAHELVLTEIDAELEGDAFFPRWSAADWLRVSHQAQVSANGVHFAFACYRHKHRMPALASTAAA